MFGATNTVQVDINSVNAKLGYKQLRVAPELESQAPQRVSDIRVHCKTEGLNIKGDIASPTC